MEEKMTPARRVFRLIAAGRPPADSKPGLLEAIHTGRVTANRLFEAAASAGIDGGNVVCLLVAALPVAGVLPMHYSREDRDFRDLEMGLDAAKQRATPIGFAFMLRDPETNKVLRHVRPFTRTEIDERALNAVLDILAVGFEQERV